ncbi:Abortive phage resistance protein abiP [Aurantiacibacter atlanticus]|uniref:Abortive phage resistance protein abiP n=2 Tax=Aurantiacibacter atlanticus TaxID=1648404 RepID=A0A0H4V8U8_9SPHN|nr:Abortive phage resistance protein abiP [Aurantiacibacter atlanticus]
MVYFLRHRGAAGMMRSWEKTYEKYQNDLGHYFRFLYHLVRYVDRSATDEKHFYIQILRATLSESELILIAVNCCYGEGRDKFKKLVEDHALLHNLSEKAQREFDLGKMMGSGAFGA